ncbi:hypothetical protein BAMA_03700 [Bacillus manliponensis]|uniref:DUF1835 domain-containing protein n=1 Tax=Bacillus manliponensis TaxID=574376 RepID=A0A073K8M8_9BACI|nr:DUF1835 domain-containing protein [Bacillus manliponensis]KEK18623.1 hypothetical protein BAMA_03700 [Bacillus manliponensis]
MTKELIRIINDMPEDEARSLLRLLLIQLNEMDSDLNEDVMNVLTHIPKQLIESQKPRLRMAESTHVHIAFGDSPAGSVRCMLKEANYNDHYVISFSDAFSIGPIQKLETEDGQNLRQQWLARHLNAEDLYFEEEYLPAFQRSMRELQSIPEEMPITIWKADNAHEHIGLCFVLAQLKGRKNVQVINTSKANNKLFSKEYNILATGELPPEKLAVMYETYKSSSLLEETVRIELEKEWQELSQHTEILKIWEENQVVAVNENYFDAFIIECAEQVDAKDNFCKSARIIGEVLGHLEQYIGDDFLEYRLRTLIEKGIFKSEGSLKAMRYYSVKLNER